MASATYTYQPRHIERHVSLTKVSMMLANVALWAALIASLAMIAR
jgi:hypothetical protein